MNAWGLQKGLRNNNQVEKKDVFPIKIFYCKNLQ